MATQLGRLGDELLLCNVSVANLPLQDVIPAAAAAGFDCMSVVARAHRRAVQRDGLTDADLRALLADHGVRVQEVEAAGDWLGPPWPAARAWLDPVYDTGRILDLASILGARTVVATHFGEPAPAEVAAAAFAALCDRAGELGLRVALEFPAMGTIADVGTAWDVVRLADRPNGGVLLDVWHHRRSGATDTDLAAVPAERILGVQLSDGAREPVGPPIDDVVHRSLPGTGELGIAPLLRELDERGVRCPVGVEVLRREIVADGAWAAAERLIAPLRAVIAAARGDAVVGSRS
jgi:sugar phosphate isomerase/epimerase